MPPFFEVGQPEAFPLFSLSSLFVLLKFVDCWQISEGYRDVICSEISFDLLSTVLNQDCCRHRLQDCCATLICKE
ncbi:hypothetical protein C4D60_Mb07t13450 [Musa balbisiana]|uniref:Secreted protein n=1 Tax=Musa balbisiana TaxID=52838 RepID=A0A4S8JHI2_MUSBA|nr:hypothetical protein C4D60_Mb07t13450 [Musa balbisiana]